MLIHSKELFEEFTRRVVIGGAFSPEERARDGRLLSEKAARDILARKRIDDRSPWLMRISGKGGYVPGPAFETRKRFRNVSLLDHIVSVARGAAVFAEIDLRGASVAETEIRTRVARAIVIGFLHDADKMLGKERSEDLSTDDIDLLIQRYRIQSFMDWSGVRMIPADMLSMIHGVEVSRSGSLRPGMRLLSSQEVGDCTYVRLADRLDGIFLDSDKGIDVIVSELSTFSGLRSDALKSGWRAIHVRSPHTPFLLSDLQRALSRATVEITGMPPLIETHHDGDLLAIIRESAAEQVIETATARATRRLNLKMRVITNPRGTRNILDGGADHRDLIEVLTGDSREASKALFINVDLLSGGEDLRDGVDETFLPFDFPANFAGLEKFSGRHYQPWPVRDDNSDMLRELRTRAAALAVGLGCQEPKDRTLSERVPDATIREDELRNALECAGYDIPEWILSITHKLSRQTLISVFAACLIPQDNDFEEAILGNDGLLHLWLCGDGEGREGLLAKNAGAGSSLAYAAEAWLSGILKRSYIAADENAPGRCHFTNIPVDLEGRIDTKSGLDGLKTSAFSGREGRPEAFDSSKSQTLVAAPAAAEHRLRSLLGEGRSGDVPAYISTPTAMGLFATLNMAASQDFLQLDQYDLARLEVKPGKLVYPESQTFGQLLMFGRHVSIPTKTAESVKMARMMILAAQRMGRPVHVFRGLPEPQNAFVHFDFLPPAIERGLGGRSLRIEQLPGAARMLRVVEEMMETSNIGIEVALRFADPATRFGAACEALATINRMTEAAAARLTSLKITLQETARSRDIPMTETDNVIIDFARAMTRVQGAPRREASNAERTLGLRIALEALESCVKTINQNGTETIVAAIAGSLENEFDRSSRMAWRGKERGLLFPRKAAAEAATIFVEKVWPVAFKSRPPASKARRIAMAVYQVAFETESYRRREIADAPAPAETA
ncbi:hypothetical protein HUK65_15505 [Rhodobacteraceae bacterium 2376]|uniref:Uncharacterized protein n=1 Tax=Rhabdonatronobacter sediminivivens TaxID=2743469 RepID=A0A7Z0KZ68_9RHOB|nr:hypothetical protein [Rhabdonatronobacter sediminivivens]NYS26392.1 hypothetical protein [Rhabdonatronobacter sediminivivens]